MRGRSLLLAPLMLAVGCDDFDDAHGYGENEIVFGIRQRVDAASGKTEVTADYDYLGLAHLGGSVTHVFRDGDGDGTCYFEMFDHRLGHPHVESGVATWSGGQIPAPGLQVLANQPDPAKQEGAAWGTGDKLTFDVTGFAMPRLEPVTMSAPRLDLDVTAITPAPADGATEVSIKTSDDVIVTWTPTPHEEPEHVMVTLETEDAAGPNGGVRCFGSPRSGSVVIPSKWVARLFSSVPAEKPIKGHVGVLSHSQVTYITRGSWIAYIVATTQHREQAFSGVR